MQPFFPRRPIAGHRGTRHLAKRLFRYRSYGLFMPFPRNLNDLEDHLPLASLFICNLMNIYATFHTDATDTARRAVPQRQMSFLYVAEVLMLFSVLSCNV